MQRQVFSQKDEVRLIKYLTMYFKLKWYKTIKLIFSIILTNWMSVVKVFTLLKGGNVNLTIKIAVAPSILIG